MRPDEDILPAVAETGDDEADQIDESMGLEPLEVQDNPDPKARKPRISVRQATAMYGNRSSDRILQQEKTKAWFANRELIRRLMKDPAGFKTGELNFIAGTAVDKVAKKEMWNAPPKVETPNEWITKFVEVLGQHGASLKLEVTGRAEPRAIDATVIPAIDSGESHE